MARVEIPVTQVTVAGVEPAAQVTGDATNNHFIAGNDGSVVVEVENTEAEAAKKVTILTPRETGGVAVEDPAISVAAGKKKLIGPFSPQVFNQGTDNGRVYLNPENNKLKFRAFRV